MRTAATRVRFHPQNNAMLSTSGPSHLRVWRLAPDFTLKPQQMVLTRVEQQVSAPRGCAPCGPG